MITASVHEPDSIIFILKSSAEVTVSNITPGDYVFPPCGIERKTYSDFLQSLKTRRLLDQLSRLKACYPYSYLIIEEPNLLSIIAPKDSHALHVYKVILYLHDKGICTLFSASPEHTAQIILLIHKRMKRKFPSLVCSPARYRPKAKTLRDEQIHFLQGIPGIGATTAKKILAEKESIFTFFSRSQVDQTKAIGRKRARHMRILMGLPIRIRK